MADTKIFLPMGPYGPVPIKATETSPGSGVYRISAEAAKERYTPYMIAAAGTYNIMGSACFVNRIRVLAAGGNVKIYRGGVLDPLHYDATPVNGDILADEQYFANGLTIVTAGAAVILVSYGAG